MSGDVLVGWVNHVYNSDITAVSEEAGLPAVNIQNDIGDASTAWQTRPGVTSGTAGAHIRISPGNPRVWRAFAACRTNLTPGGLMTVRLYNNSSDVPIFIGVGVLPEPAYGQSIVIADQDYTADYCVFSFDDPLNPDGHINVPLIFAGPAWIPQVGMSWDSALGRDGVTDSRVSRGGQVYPTPRFQSRRWEVDFKGIQGDELWSEAQELDRVSRYMRNVLFVPDMTSMMIGNESIFGIVESMANVSPLSGITGVFAWRFKIMERL